MTVQPKLRAFTLLAVIALLANVVAIGFTSRAMAYCSSCNTPAPVAYSAGYAAPVAYQAAYAPAPVVYQAAYAPAPVAYTTAYAPAYNTGWYPGRFLGRVNRSIWGVPTTTYYAPTYTAAYAPTYTAAYAPSYTAAYAPACSSCSAATVSYAPSYAPACSACTASYAPACSSCSTCDACAASSTPCASCAAGSVSQAAYSEVVNVPAGSTYTTPSNTLEPTPAIPPDANIPSTREVEKPAPVDPLSLPEAQGDAAEDSTDDSATNLQAPKLFDPNDRTAARHPAPVWTAVYHRMSGAESTAQPISWQQVERDAEGWSSAAE